MEAVTWAKRGTAGGVLLALIVISSPVEAGQRVLFAVDVPDRGEPQVWSDESLAEGRPEDIDCDNRTYAFSEPTHCDSDVALVATDFDLYTFPPGDDRITQVAVDVLCRYDTDTRGSIFFRVIGPGVDTKTQQTARFGNPDGNCIWRLSNFVVAPPPGGWTRAVVNSLEFRVRRVGCDDNRTTLRVKAFRIIVTSDSPPPPPSGACCLPNGDCNPLEPSECITLGGVYQGDDIRCRDVKCPEPSGACCYQNGDCQVITKKACKKNKGRFQQEGLPCEQANCPQPEGACCFSNGNCDYLEQGECNGQGGVYQGDDIRCHVVECPEPPGACCYPDGHCAFIPKVACSGTEGRFQGEDVSCQPNPCPQPEGACCLPNGDCDSLARSECSKQGGDYRGDDIRCRDVVCPGPPGACCYPDGHCVFIPKDACNGAEGRFQGEGVLCEPGRCQLRGACCFPDGNCETIERAECVSRGGNYQGDNVPCRDANCPQPPPGRCEYQDVKVKEKGGCQSCPPKRGCVVQSGDCGSVGDCKKKLTESTPCLSGPGSCMVKMARCDCRP